MARGSHFCCPARGGQPWWWWCRSGCLWSGGGVVVTLGGRGPKASAVMRAAAEASAGLSFHGGTGALWAPCIWGRVGGAAARIDQLVSGAKVGRAHDSPRWWPRNVRLNRDPPAVVFIIREARATLAHLQYLLVAAFFLCRQPPCSLLSPTHHRINFALSNCDHLLYLSPLDWPNPSIIFQRGIHFPPRRITQLGIASDHRSGTYLRSTDPAIVAIFVRLALRQEPVGLSTPN